MARPRRSVLFVPCSNPRALAKARSLGMDGLILDLEDAVAPAAKDDARARVVAELATGGFGPREIAVRVNGADTPWGEQDLAAVAACRAHAVVLPKIERPETIRAAEHALRESGAPDTLALWCMVETPLGVLRAAEIAGASSRLVALVVGTSDLVKDLRAVPTAARHEVATALSLCVLAARAFGLAVLDGVHLDLEDEAGFEAACRQARELGFDGKTLIHPKTIETANRVFAPSAEEVARARRIIDAHAEAVAAGRGVTVVDGRLVEALHVEAAQRTVALAAAIAGRG